MGHKTIPTLPSRNFDETARFYKPLGFVEQARWPEYLILQHPDDDVELHFWLNSSLNPKENDVSCYIRWDTAAEARALYDSWRAIELANGRLHPPTETDYGLLEFAVVDSFGNLIRIGGSLSSGTVRS